MAWEKIPASNSLFAELDRAFPNREKASDGTIGDGEHSTSPSDHNPDETGRVESESDSDNINEVHAADVDTDLRQAGWSMEKVVRVILARCRSGQEKRVRYIIYNRRIWQRATGWVTTTYGGGDPHDTHMHMSFRYGSGSGTGNPENITSSWGIYDAVHPKEWDEVATEAQLEAVIKRVLQTGKQPYVLSVIKDRGWSDLSVNGKLDYILSNLVAAGLIDADHDGLPAEAASVQARLARIEEMLLALTDPAAAAKIPARPVPVAKK